MEGACVRAEGSGRGVWGVGSRSREDRVLDGLASGGKGSKGSSEERGCRSRSGEKGSKGK